MTRSICQILLSFISGLVIACRMQACTYESLMKPTPCIKICSGKSCNSDVSLTLYLLHSAGSSFVEIGRPVRLCQHEMGGEWGSFKYCWSLSTSTIRINHPGLALSQTHQQTVWKIRMFAFCVDPGLNITLCLDQTHGGEHDSR